MAFDGRVISNVGVLAAVVEGGSFARAADTLGLSRSGVSRAVSRLEARIGIQLFDRTTRAISLTDEGRRLYSEVTPLLTGIDEAVVAMSAAAVSVRGRLRVNVDAFFSSLLLAPILGDFLALHPEVMLDIVAKEQLGDLIGEGFDLAIRFGTPPSSSLMARKLLDTRTITVASPGYLERHGQPQSPRDIEQHACILVRDHQTGQPIDEWIFAQGNKTERVKLHGRLMVAEFGTMLGACAEGVGIARVKAIGVQRHIEQGTLIEVLPTWLGDSFPLYALFASRHLPSAKVRVFIDFISGRIAGVRDGGQIALG